MAASRSARASATIRRTALRRDGGHGCGSCWSRTTAGWPPRCSSALTRRGYEVEHAATVAAALSAAPCDLVLLDLTLPDGDGTDLCRELRRRSSQLGIIAVTARGEERDRVLGLRLGADDYVVKPFSMVELQARIEAVLRRAAHAAPARHLIEAGPVRIDVAARTVTVDGRPSR